MTERGRGRLAVLLATLLTLLATLLVPSGASAAPSVEPSGGFRLEEWGSGPMGQMVLMFRKGHPEFLNSQRNIAVMELAYEGHTYHMVGPSVPGFLKRVANPDPLPLDIWIDGTFYETEEVRIVDLATGADPVLLPKKRKSGSFNPYNKHAEQILAKLLDGREHRQYVEAILSELQFCTTPSNSCRTRIPGEVLPNLRNGSYNYAYHGDGTHSWEDGRSRDARRADLRAWQEAGMPVDLESVKQAYVPLTILSEPGAAPANGPVTEALTGTKGNGGIDFSTLELRYLSDPGDGRPVQYSFSAQQGPAASQEEGRRVAQLQSDAFFVWLTLPRRTFWVNLNPSEPDRVIDDGLGQTDAGRVLLEADLQMKKTIGQLIHPDSPLGKQYWTRVLADGKSCSSFRTWIVPAPATVREDGDSVHILDAPLEVRTEAERMPDAAGNSEWCTGQTEAALASEEAAYRDVVLPKLREVVNTAPEYADVRRVYLARVAAEWYRQRSEHSETRFGHMIDSRSVAGWRSREPWSPRNVFDRYVDSYNRKEFNVSREITQGGRRVVATYIYGGVDLSRVPLRDVGGTEFDRKWPDRAALVDQSVAEATTDQTGQVWLGSEVPSPAAAKPDAVSTPDTWLAILGLYGIVAVGGGVMWIVFGRRVRRWRR